jgi:hypothetical protein
MGLLKFSCVGGYSDANKATKAKTSFSHPPTDYGRIPSNDTVCLGLRRLGLALISSQFDCLPSASPVSKNTSAARHIHISVNSPLFIISVLLTDRISSLLNCRNGNGPLTVPCFPIQFTKQLIAGPLKPCKLRDASRPLHLVCCRPTFASLPPRLR